MDTLTDSCAAVEPPHAVCACVLAVSDNAFGNDRLSSGCFPSGFIVEKYRQFWPAELQSRILLSHQLRSSELSFEMLACFRLGRTPSSQMRVVNVTQPRLKLPFNLSFNRLGKPSCVRSTVLSRATSIQSEHQVSTLCPHFQRPRIPTC